RRSGAVGHGRAGEVHAGRPCRHWVGTWNNLTFKTQGTLSPGPQTFTLPAGAGANHWTAKGFSIANPNAAFGAMNVTDVYPLGTLAGSGKNPQCAPGLLWKLTGKFTAKAFSATAHITLPGGGQATTVVKLAKK
ncbi:MAG TPA: hypothetical protein VKP14_01485, partial [Gaiellaceae bacterium]|nr:hypothetical protein [Gaiellaceae bacterium]